VRAVRIATLPVDAYWYVLLSTDACRCLLMRVDACRFLLVRANACWCVLMRVDACPFGGRATAAKACSESAFLLLNTQAL